jgi:hypothetical protein
MPVPVQNIRSSVKDKVPDPSKLEPGQLAINNHHENPGLFTLAEDGTVIRLAASSVFMYL